jgi:serine/threonine protein phosphatase 1
MRPAQIAHMIRIGLWQSSPVTVARPVFAIGDVHGEADRMVALETEISRIVAREIKGQARLVRLGDLIDRGPKSLAALAHARNGLGIPQIEETTLLGNHEVFLLSALGSEGRDLKNYLEDWMTYGANLLFAEIGLTLQAVLRDPNGARARLYERLGNDTIQFLTSCPTFLREGPILFVHAGIHPTRPVAEFLNADPLAMPQKMENHPLWIREPFLSWSARFEDNLFVVHGHTITEAPDLRTNRLGIDTGAYAGRPLTAVEFRESRLRFIRATR